MRKLLGAVILSFIGALGSGAAGAAPVTIGGITVDSQNFVDELLSSFTTGSWSTQGGTLDAVTTDLSVDTWAFSNASQAYLQLGFTDNVMVNGAGNDLVVWEIGTPDNFGISLTVGGTTQTIVSAATGFSNAQGFGINVAYFDLDAFGIAPGGSVSSFVANMGFPFVNTSASPTFGAAAALNSAPVPEPESLLLLLLAALSALVVSRKRV